MCWKFDGGILFAVPVSELIISPKFEISGIEISGILWFWSGRRSCIRRRRTPRLVFHVTATPMRVSNSYLIQPLIEWKNPIDFGENRKTKWPPTAIL